MNKTTTSTDRNVRQGAWRTAWSEARRIAQGTLPYDITETCNPDVTLTALEVLRQTR